MSTPVNDNVDTASSSDESEIISQNRSDTPDVCPICLGKMREKAFVNACLHQFCFGCLWDWIKVKLECPLCKQKIISVIHNVKADDDYSEIRVERIQGRETLNADYFPRGPIIPPEGLDQHAPLLLMVPEDEEQLMPQLLSPEGTATPSPPPDNVDILIAARALLPSPQHSEILPPLPQSPQPHAEILPPQALSPEPYLHDEDLDEQLHPESPQQAELDPQQNYQPSHAQMHPPPQAQMLPTHTPQPSHSQAMPTQSYPLPYPQSQLVPFPYLPPPPPPPLLLTAQSHQYSQAQMVPPQACPSHAQIMPPQTCPSPSQHTQSMPPIHQPPPPPQAQFNSQQSHQASRVYVQQSQAHLSPQSRHSEILAQTSTPPLIQLTDNMPAQSHPPPLLRLSEATSPPPLLRITETLPAHSHSTAASHSHVSSQRAQTPPPPLIPITDAVPPHSWSLLPPAAYQYTQTFQTQIQHPPPQARAQQRHLQQSHSVTSAQQTQHNAQDTEPLNLSRSSQRSLLQYAIQAALNSIALPKEHQAQLYKQDHQMYRQGLGPPGVADSDDCIVVKHVRPQHKRTAEMVSYDSDVDWAQVNEQREFQAMNSNPYLSSPSTSRHVPNYNQAPCPRGYHWRGPLKRRGEYNYSESDSD